MIPYSTPSSPNDYPAGSMLTILSLELLFSMLKFLFLVTAIFPLRLKYTFFAMSPSMQMGLNGCIFSIEAERPKYIQSSSLKFSSNSSKKVNFLSAATNNKAC